MGRGVGVGVGAGAEVGSAASAVGSGRGAESVQKHRSVFELPIGADFVRPVLEKFSAGR